MHALRHLALAALLAVGLNTVATAAGSVCVLLPTPAHSAEVVGMVQYEWGVEVLIEVSPPAPDINSIQVLDPRAVSIPVDIPAFSITSVRTIDDFNGGIATHLLQDVGLWVLFDKEQPSGGRSFDFDMLGGSGWIESSMIGWVYMDSSGWSYSESLGWIWAIVPEVAQDPLNLAECGPRATWFWRASTNEWTYVIEGSAQWIYTQNGGWTEL